MRRKNRILTSVAIASAACLTMTSLAKAAFVVESWLLLSSTKDIASAMGNGAFSNVVQNPFNQSINAAYGNSIAQAAHQFNWNLATGHFDTSVHLESQGGADFAAGSDNLVRITTSTDVLLHAEGQWAYHIGGGFRQMEFTTIVGMIPHSDAFFFADGGFATPTLGDPANGMFDANLDVLLPAGGTYFCRSIFSFTASGGSPTDLSIGTGFANFTLTSVPEPAGLGVLAFAAILIRRRNRFSR